MASKEQSKIRGYYDFNQPLSKTQPAKASDPSCGDMTGQKNTEHRDFNNGDHNFNYAGKVKQMGGQFHEFGKSQAGLHFNGDDKDSSINYLKDRNMKGQEIRNFSGGNRNAKIHTNNGGTTAYNGNPIREVYTPATSNKVASAEPVMQPIIKKEETIPTKDQTHFPRKLKK